MGDRLSLLPGISSRKWKTRFPKNAARINSETEECKTVCLNKSSALVGLHDARGDHVEERTSNRSYRFASYKQFTCWVFRSLWKRNRRMILSCVLWIIQNLFPEPDNKYVLFTDRKKIKYLSEAVTRRCFVEKLLLEILQNSQENTCARVSFLIKLQASTCNFIKKETMAQVFCILNCLLYHLFLLDRNYLSSP